MAAADAELQAGIRAALQQESQQWDGDVWSGPDGRATYFGLAPGVRYQINALIEEPERIKVGASEPFSGAPGERLEDVVVVCRLKGGIEGCLRDPAGSPVANTEVGSAAVLPDGTVIEPATAMTDASGCFVILHAFPEGVYETIGVGYLRDGMVHRGVVEQVQIEPEAVVDLGTLACEPVMTAEELEEHLRAAQE
jgi:hypothetical protein